MCSSWVIHQVLFSSALSPLLHNPSSHHHFIELLHFLCSEKHSPWEYIPPPMADTSCMCSYVGTLPNWTSAGKIQTYWYSWPSICLLISSWPHAQPSSLSSPCFICSADSQLIHPENSTRLSPAKSCKQWRKKQNKASSSSGNGCAWRHLILYFNWWVKTCLLYQLIFNLFLSILV